MKVVNLTGFTVHIISYKTLLKHFKTFRHVSILSDHHQELCFLLKLHYSIHNSIRIGKRSVVAAYYVVWECVVEQWLGVRCVRHNPHRKQQLSRPPPIQKFGPENYMLQLNIYCS